MIKISRLADYAVVVLSALEKAGDARMSAMVLSEKLCLPEPTVAKVLKLLAKGGLVISTRGVNGGYSIARPASEISVVDMIAAVDGPVALTACVEGAGSGTPCNYDCICPVKRGWNKVNTAVVNVMKEFSLQDLLGAQEL